MTRYSKLLDKRQIEQETFSREQVGDRLKIARRDLVASAEMLGSAHEWAYAIAYNAMLQSGRAFMFNEGFRAKGEGHHLIVIQFLRAGLGPEWEDVLDVMDRMRRKRNRSLYDTTGAISIKEAGEAVETAKDFVTRIDQMLEKTVSSV